MTSQQKKRARDTGARWGGGKMRGQETALTQTDAPPHPPQPQLMTYMRRKGGMAMRLSRRSACPCR